ncbi:hypothetical protein [Nocardia rhamnosiphila]
MTAGWVVSGPTGASTVCRTYDDLVEEVGERSGLPVDAIRDLGLAR